MKKNNNDKNKNTKRETEDKNKGPAKKLKKHDSDSPSELNLQLVPWIITLFALFILLCMFLPASSGWLGQSFKKFFCGLFSYAAYLIPPMLLIRAINYRKEATSKSPGTNWWLSFIFLCVFACLLATIKCDVNKIFTFEHYTKAFNESHSLTTNSLVGGFLAKALSFAIGRTFTIILCAIAMFVVAPFLFAKTPLDVIRFFAKKIRDKRLKKKDRKPHKEEAVENIEESDEYETDNAEEEEPEDVPQPDTHKKRREKIELEEDFVDEEEEPETVTLPPTSPVADDTADVTPTEDVNVISTQKKKKLEKIFNPEDVVEPEKEGDHPAPEIIEGFSASTDIPDDDEDTPVETKKEPVDFSSDEPEEEAYRFPPIEILKKGEGVSPALSQEYEATAKKLVETLASFNVRTRIINIAKGPTVTRYELQPETGVRVRNIRNLSDDIALNLASKGVRIEAPIPGKEAVGIEVPNKIKSIVRIRELIESKTFEEAKSQLSTCLGVDVAGNPIYCDIAKMPHILIAGTTGSGKSVCINSLLVSILYKATPDEVKFILIDPKKIELGVYNGIPHLLVPVVSDPKKAAGALAWAVGEMERRFALIEEVGVRDIRTYNEVARMEEDRESLPRIVIVIDELADLMMMAKDNVESSICRIAQKARAAGMHLVIGTQRPSVDVITGLIKANVPSRIAFTVASQVDSKTILDVAGAEKLVGQGDMLYAPVGAMTPTRVQGSFVSDSEIEEIIDFLKGNGVSAYSDEVIEGIEREAERCVDKGRSKASSDEEFDDDGDNSLSSDPMLKPAIEIALDSGTISTSMLQRRLKLGYARAARLIDKMEALGVVSEFAGSKPRTVLISRERYLEMVTNSEE